MEATPNHTITDIDEARKIIKPHVANLGFYVRNKYLATVSIRGLATYLHNLNQLQEENKRMKQDLAEIHKILHPECCDD